MFEVRIHGRGGQMVAMTAELLAAAASVEGRYVQAFPRIGTERAGAPAVAYCRVGDLPLRARGPIYRPDAVIVQDASLRHRVAVFAGLAPGGYALINSLRDGEELELARYGNLHPDRTLVLPATELALVHTGRPMPAAAMLGGLAALTGQFGIEALVVALHRRFPHPLAEANAQLALTGYTLVRERQGDLAAA